MPGLITRLLKSNSIEPAILLLAPLFFLLIQPVYSQNEEKNNPPESAALELEKSIERELAGSDVLVEDKFARIPLAQYPHCVWPTLGLKIYFKI